MIPNFKINNFTKALCFSFKKNKNFIGYFDLTNLFLPGFFVKSFKLIVNLMLAFFGHPKSGSTWLSGFFLGLGYDMGLKIFYKQAAFYENNPKALADLNPDIIISQNSAYNAISCLPNLKALHVIRDPRDIIVSSYFSSKKTHAINNWPELENLRKELNETSMEDGLFKIMAFNYKEINHLANWNYNDPRILELKFEDIVKSPSQYLEEVLQHFDILEPNNFKLNYCMTFIKGKCNRLSNKLGIYDTIRLKGKNVNKIYIKKVLDKLSFTRLSRGRKRGISDENSHYRKGLPGEWITVFNEAHKNYFKYLYKDIVVHLGYENDNYW